MENERSPISGWRFEVLGSLDDQITNLNDILIHALI